MKTAEELYQSYKIKDQPYFVGLMDKFGFAKALTEHDKEKTDYFVLLIDEQIKPLQKYLDEVECKNEILVAKVKGSIEALTELKKKLGEIK